MKWLSHRYYHWISFRMDRHHFEWPMDHHHFHQSPIQMRLDTKPKQAMVARPIVLRYRLAVQHYVFDREPFWPLRNHLIGR